jgi:hypothetical protein
MKNKLAILCLVAVTAKAGDIINYGPAIVHNDRIVIAHDSRAHEPRWHSMLDPDDLRRLEFIRARHTSVLQIQR